MSSTPTFRLQLLHPEGSFRGTCSVQSAGCQKRADYMLHIGIKRVVLCSDHLQELKATLDSPAEPMKPAAWMES